MITLYGIPNCDTVKKARVWLENNDVEYQFHDFKKQGLSEAKVQEWLQSVGADTLINKRSTTWKQLSDADKANALDGDPTTILVQNPTLVKRPVVETPQATQVGFKAEQYNTLFS